MTLRTATAADEDHILAWNAADVHFLAPMDRARLAYLRERANAVEIIELEGRRAGFVITFVEGSDYDSENYRWFSEREPLFQYVDRIVVDPAQRGRGLARRVYTALIERMPDRPLLAEVNHMPPNPVSLGFHTDYGFEEMGRLDHRSYGVVLLKFAPQSP